MPSNRLDKLQRYIAVIAVICIVLELWIEHVTYTIFAHGNDPAEIWFIRFTIFLPTGIWLLFAGGAILAWLKKWRWFVYAPLLLIYPGMVDQVSALYTMIVVTGHWYWIIGLSAISKLAFFCLSLYGIYLYIARSE